MNIKGSSALVTGGASGLGAATVRMLAANGAKVVIVDINEKSGGELVRELGASVTFVKTDVTNEDQMRAAVEQAASGPGGLRIAVASAGIGVAEKLLGKNGPHDFQRFIRVLQVNLVGTFALARAAALAMSANNPDEDGGRGVIVTTASVAAFEGQIGQVAYSASKGGIVSMTLPLARELARSGIRVMTIAPGIFHTPLLGALPEAARASLAEQVPFPKRLGQPAEYASLVKQIVENNMLNGSTIRIDGAIRMAAK
ncbi:MAG TPA: SDR family NAD(P)-dependent oxidoreductase [Verrucomicrobiae bacterium]|jgi:3-hydroxyacyl-CoA dehydrogenase/3-hydroxy-2-methylbutyryl-CoA dehydrogenase|nr:SDR family NAD(P)-dependent oxidoreductase [Verrucomicrobiae bacterium]